MIKITQLIYVEVVSSRRTGRNMMLTFTEGALIGSWVQGEIIMEKLKGKGNTYPKLKPLFLIFPDVSP